MFKKIAGYSIAALAIAGLGAGTMNLALDSFPPTQEEQLSGKFIEACEFEDTIPTDDPCYWDGDLRGIDGGASFVAFPDGSVKFD